MITEAAGGKDNLSSCIHCATRLRISVKDKDLVDLDKVQKADGVSGALWVGDQLQVIIGAAVGELYDVFCSFADLKKETEIDENLDKKKKKTFKELVSSLIETLMACIVPSISLFVAMGLFAGLVSLFGPQGLVKLFTEESGIYKLLNWTQTGIQFFIPMIIAYTASRKFGCSTVASLAIVSVLLFQDLLSEVSAGTFNLFGIAPIAYTLNGQLIPVILMCFIQSKVEALFKKVIPASLHFTFVNFFVLIIMIPLTLYVLSPIGILLGMALAFPVTFLNGICPPLVPTLIGALWITMVSLGIHVGLGALFMTDFFTTGVNFTLLPVSYSLGFIGAVTDLAILLKSKDENTKKMASNGIVSHLVGGVAEPSIYAIYLKKPKTLIAISAGLAAAGLYFGLRGVGVYALSSTNFLSLTGFLAGGIDNLFKAIPGILIGCVVSFVLVMILGVESKADKEN